jgi:hypothetical protein
VGTFFFQGGLTEIKADRAKNPMMGPRSGGLFNPAVVSAASAFAGYGRPKWWAKMVQVFDQLGRDHGNKRILLDIIDEEMKTYRCAPSRQLRLRNSYVGSRPGHCPIQNR